MDVRIQTGWDNDPAGRIRNLSLAPNAKNSLFPLFEAVMNSIHAVEDRFGKDNLSKGEVTIELHRTELGRWKALLFLTMELALTKAISSLFVEWTHVPKKRLAEKA